MAISTNIDGTTKSGTDQVLDLISMISDPVGYKKKIDELNASIAKNEATIALVGPAKDVLVLRDKAAEALAKADEILKDAQKKSDENIVATKKAVEDMLTEAQKKAAEITVAAHVSNKEAEEAAAALKVELAAAKRDRAALAKATADANAARDDAIAEKETAIAERAAAASERAAILAQHKAFLESIAPPQK